MVTHLSSFLGRVNLPLRSLELSCLHLRKSLIKKLNTQKQTNKKSMQGDNQREQTQSRPAYQLVREEPLASNQAYSNAKKNKFSTQLRYSSTSNINCKIFHWELLSLVKSIGEDSLNVSLSYCRKMNLRHFRVILLPSKFKILATLYHDLESR